MYSYEYRDFTFEKKEKLDSKNKWVKVFKNGPSKICARRALKKLK